MKFISHLTYMAFYKPSLPSTTSICTSSYKRKTIFLSLFFLIFFLLLFLGNVFFSNPKFVDVEHLHIQAKSSQPQSSFHPNKIKPPEWFKVILENKLRPHQTLKVGLVNFEDPPHSYLNFGGTVEIVTIKLEPVSSNVTWEKLFPEWVDETQPEDSCPEIPMPKHGTYSGLDVVVAKLPCTKVKEEINMNGNCLKEGIRDVHRLQISLATAQLVVENGISSKDKNVYVVFVGKCNEPMVELFRCNDLIWHKGDYWVYKPNVKKLKDMIGMPVGSCALHHPNAGTSGSRELQANGNQFLHKLQNVPRSTSTYTPKEAYVTIIHSSEDYVCGAIALAQSILQTNTTKELVLLADHTISHRSILRLRLAGWIVKRIERIDSPNRKMYAYNKWNYSKLRVWELVEYDKLMYIDSDFIVLRNIDHFFNLPQLSAAPNHKWLFNTGIMVIEPSKCFFDDLMAKRFSLKSYNGGDQGYLNEVLTWWHRLTLKINFMKIFSEGKRERLVPKDRYTIHFLGTKPWLCNSSYDCNWDRLENHRFASDDAHAYWWKVYDAMPRKLKRYCATTKKQDKGVHNRKPRVGEHLIDKFTNRFV